MENIWCRVYFYCYWHRYILLSAKYTIANNFLSNNAYLRAELNAHAFNIFIVTLREHPQHRSNAFLCPGCLDAMLWKSIPCCAHDQHIFKYNNFLMLSILRRLYRLQIQLSLESEYMGIIYPRVVEWMKKDGHNLAIQFDVQAISNDDHRRLQNYATTRAN